MLFNGLQKTLAQVAELESLIPDERKQLLNKMAATFKLVLTKGQALQLNFICTENSRRSHLSHFMATAAAHHFGVPVQTFSGGTKVSACNPRTVAALKRAGFQITNGLGNNPHYEVKWGADTPPLLAYSKLYDAPENPQANFFAVMVCGHADENCPFIPTALGRFAVTFNDPKVADDTPEESATYDARLKEIGSQFYYMFKTIAQ
jgi:arsenate reductase (thioredoxin)